MGGGELCRCDRPGADGVVHLRRRRVWHCVVLDDTGVSGVRVDGHRGGQERHDVGLGDLAWIARPGVVHGGAAAVGHRRHDVHRDGSTDRSRCGGAGKSAGICGCPTCVDSTHDNDDDRPGVDPRHIGRGING